MLWPLPPEVQDLMAQLLTMQERSKQFKGRLALVQSTRPLPASRLASFTAQVARRDRSKRNVSPTASSDQFNA
jgi:hypothetical protein